MKITFAIFFLAIGVIGMANNNGNATLFGMIGLIFVYGLSVIRDSYLKSEKRHTGLLPITFLSIFSATNLAAQAAEAPVKFERRYSYMESRDKHDPITYSFSIDCLLISNGELLKIVIGNEADLLPIVGWGTDANGDPYLDSEEYRIIVRKNEIIRIWAYSVRNYDVFKVQKI